MNIIQLHQEYMDSQRATDELQSQIVAHLQDAENHAFSIYHKLYSQKFSVNKIRESEQFSWLNHYKQPGAKFTSRGVIDAQGKHHVIDTVYFEHDTWKTTQHIRKQLRALYKEELRAQHLQLRKEVSDAKRAHERATKQLQEKEELLQSLGKELNKIW